jgi:CRP-like cAMP-binding protein
MISLDFLETVDIFKDLSSDQLTAIQACCQEETFGRDDRIFSAHEDPVALWVVREGTVTLRQDQSDVPPALRNITVSDLSESMTFGWSSLVSPYKYRLSAYCTSQTCSVLKVDRPSFSHLLEEDPHLGYRVMSKLLVVVGTRFHNLREEIIKGLGQDIISRW